MFWEHDVPILFSVKKTTTTTNSSSRWLDPREEIQKHLSVHLGMNSHHSERKTVQKRRWHTLVISRQLPAC